MKNIRMRGTFLPTKGSIFWALENTAGGHLYMIALRKGKAGNCRNY